ncbi:MAG: hypothetical protein ACLVKK_09880 [Ruthenibacterium sp.]
MKKPAVICLLLALLLTACAPAPGGAADGTPESGPAAPSASSSMSSCTNTASSSFGESKAEPVVPAIPPFTGPEDFPPVSYDTLNIDPAEEPPYDPADYPDLPSFLNAEQKDLYCRAKELSSELLITSDSSFPLLPGQEPVLSTTAHSIEGYIGLFSPATSRYRTWNDFYAVVTSVFTLEWFYETAFSSPEEPGGLYYASYLEQDGQLLVCNRARGTNRSRTAIPDSYELISQSEDEVLFHVIGYYMNSGKDGLGITDSYDYTEAFPIRMVRTEEGWRLAEYHITY